MALKRSTSAHSVFITVEYVTCSQLSLRTYCGRLMMDRSSQVSQIKLIFKSWKHTLTISKMILSHFPCQTLSIPSSALAEAHPLSSFNFPCQTYSISSSILDFSQSLVLTFFAFFAILCHNLSCLNLTFFASFNFPLWKYFFL